MHDVHANGAAIPALGLGTWKLDVPQASHMVADALKGGYRHIDTAQIYENEEGVGHGWRASGVARDAFFLTTKVWTDKFAPGDLEASVDESLAKLQTDHVDLLLLHWPVPGVPLADTLGALNAVQAKGQTRFIGVSNYPVATFEEARRLSDAPIVTNQVEYHVYLDQSPVLAAARAAGSSVTAYSPLARGKIADDRVIGEIAAKHGRTNGQVALRWLIEQDQVIAIPKTANPARAIENLAAGDFALDAEDMARLNALGSAHGRIIDPSWGPTWDVPA